MANLDERAMEIYMAGKGTLKQAYEQARYEQSGAETLAQFFNGFQKGAK